MSDARNDRISLRAIVTVAVLIALTIVLAGAASWWLWTDAFPPHARDTSAARPEVKAGPLLESAPQPDRASYDAEKQRELHGWQWVDRRAGIARIPIEQAMQLMAVQAASRDGTAQNKKGQ